MLLSLANVWLGRLYAIFNWTLSDALGGLGRYERLLSSKLQNSRVFFSKSVCRARSGDALFSRKAREDFFAVVVVFFAPLWNLTLRFYPHSRPSLWRARARWFLTKAKIRAVLQSTYQEKRFLSPERRCFSFERYFKHLLRFSQFSDPTDVGAFTTKLPTTNQSELQVTFGLLYVWQWTYIWY